MDKNATKWIIWILIFAVIVYFIRAHRMSEASTEVSTPTGE